MRDSIVDVGGERNTIHNHWVSLVTKFKNFSFSPRERIPVLKRMQNTQTT